MVGRVPGRAVGAAFVALCLLLGTGCVGDVDRADFDRNLAARSRGLPASLPLRAVDALAEELGTDEVELRSLVVEGDDRQVVLVARVPGTDELVAHRYAGGVLSLGRDESGLGADVLEAETFRPAQVPALAELDRLAKTTLDELRLTGRGLVDGLVVDRPRVVDGIRLVLSASDEDSGRGGEVEFDADGELVEVRPS